MHADYLSPAIRQLRDQQVRSAPHEKQIEQADAAERLLNELDPERTYDCQYVCHRVTGNGYVSAPGLKLAGREARHDLRLFVEDLSDAASAPASAAGERVLTARELAREFRVSTKTVSRWRRHGLVGRRFLFNGRKRLGFLQSSVGRFVALNEERVRRGARFSRLTDEERGQIVGRARCLAQAGGLPAGVVKRIAQETGRSVETVQHWLRRYDREHPDTAVFPYNRGPLQNAMKEQVYRQYCHGEPVQEIARRFHQAPARIDRIIRRMRAARIMDLPLDYVGNEQFTRLRSRTEEAGMLGPAPESHLPAKKPRLPGGLPSYLASLYEVPLLTGEQEVHLFRKMNYLKFKAGKLREKLGLDRPDVRLMDRIERLYDESVAVRNQVVRANLRLVVSIAKRYVGPAGDFFELVSDGNMSMMRAVEKFDFSRGNKFSTYASWAVIKNFARTIPDAVRRRDRFRTCHAEMLSASADARADQYEQETAQLGRESRVRGILERLDERERQIVASRFGLTPGREPMTLTQVGAAMGVTKERIRQIQWRAMGKLRQAAAEDRIEFPE